MAGAILSSMADIKTEHEKARAEIFFELRRKLASFAGKKVRVWTRFNQPVEGTFVFLSAVSPFMLFIVDDDGKPHLFNWREVVEVEAKDKFKIP